MTPIQHYESLLQPHRDAFARSDGLRSALNGALSDEQLEKVLIHFCAFGVQMTAPVERWIRVAGERCGELGYTELGEALLQHARHEAGHEKMFEADTRSLVDYWNARRTPTLSASALLAQTSPPGVSAYLALHEEVIESDAPFRQLVIEYEIEELSVSQGSQLLGAIAKQLGVEVLNRMSFMKYHAEADAGHTKFNRAQLARFLEANPDTLESLVDAGARALRAYAAFLDDCHGSS